MPPYSIVNNTTPDNYSAMDKIWTLHYIAIDDTYRFESGSSGKFMYHDFYGGVFQVYHSSLPETDGRSTWHAIPTSVTLSTSKAEISSISIKVCTNPANSNFTIVLNGISKESVTIYDILGKPVYKQKTNVSSIQIENESQFKYGIYFMKFVPDNQRVYHPKFVLQ